MAKATSQKSCLVTEAAMKMLVRNALMAAGQEMGEEGDHWPVIHGTIASIMQDWEDLEIERAVQAEIATRLYEHLDAMDEVLKSCEPDVQAEVGPRLAKLREVYDAAFTPPHEEVLDVADIDIEKMPIHLRRADAILDTLFGEDDHG
ncbi:MAG: hypothetical protein FWF24_03225 [Alphaproteobacteria bacterium]|nr:hypothetical protein [Alphaproteobacteria bacterium]